MTEPSLHQSLAKFAGWRSLRPAIPKRPPRARPRRPGENDGAPADAPRPPQPLSGGAAVAMDDASPRT